MPFRERPLERQEPKWVCSVNCYVVVSMPQAIRSFCVILRRDNESHQKLQSPLCAPSLVQGSNVHWVLEGVQQSVSQPLARVRVRRAQGNA